MLRGDWCRSLLSSPSREALFVHAEYKGGTRVSPSAPAPAMERGPVS
jgi:hypothetical protein